MTQYSGNSGAPRLYRNDPELMMVFMDTGLNFLTKNVTNNDTNATVAAFYNQLSNTTPFNGKNDVTGLAPANIAAGFDLINKTGRGLLGAIVCPLFAVNTGDCFLNIVLDGQSHVFNLQCTTGQRIVLIPALQDSEINVGFQKSATGYDAVATGPRYIKSVKSYAQNGSAIYFDKSLKVTFTSAVAIDTNTPQGNYGVQCLMLG